MKKQFFFLFLVASFINAHAQTSLPVPRNIARAYDNETRSNTGEPGKNYWQNRADYNINVSFSPATRLIDGNEEINYVNNSPDTLHEILFKLYPNVYKKGSARDFIIKPEDISEGVIINHMNINDTVQNIDKLQITGTNMIVRTSGILPGATVKFKIDFSYFLNKSSHNRTGMVDDSSAFVAYFFPRIAVYDDIYGWNSIAYTGTQEFYNDFCNFNVAVSVPKNFIVCATGNLNNSNEVYNAEIVKRIAQAEESAELTKVIDTVDLKEQNITASQAINTWKFSADSVTDFAFATANHYIWYAKSVIIDSATQRRTRVDAVFNPLHKDFFEVVDFAGKTVDYMSHRFPAWPFPYPHETVFDGLDQMEYPMMVNDNPLEDREETITLTDHEIFHTMFPFYMGVNETKNAWMDEGWATVGEWILSPWIDSSIADDYGMESYNSTAGFDIDMPITTISTEETGLNYYLNSYPKPAMGYLYLKDMLGDTLFTKALHYYINTWHGKHPAPLDFFNCLNTGSSKNLNWFFKAWFYDNGYPDLAVAKASQTATKLSVTIEKKGSKPVPVDITITYEDSTTESVHESVAIWEKTSTYTYTTSITKPVATIQLGSLHNADINSDNNIYSFEDKASATK